MMEVQIQTKIQAEEQSESEPLLSSLEQVVWEGLSYIQVIDNYGT